MQPTQLETSSFMQNPTSCGSPMEKFLNAKRCTSEILEKHFIATSVKKQSRNLFRKINIYFRMKASVERDTNIVAKVDIFDYSICLDFCDKRRIVRECEE